MNSRYVLPRWMTPDIRAWLANEYARGKSTMRNIAKEAKDKFGVPVKLEHVAAAALEAGVQLRDGKTAMGIWHAEYAEMKGKRSMSKSKKYLPEWVFENAEKIRRIKREQVANLKYARGDYSQVN